MVLSPVGLPGHCSIRPKLAAKNLPNQGFLPVTLTICLSQNATKSPKKKGKSSAPLLVTSPMDSKVAKVAESYTRVRRSPIHGRGLFAAGKIPKGAYLGTYEGVVTDRDGCYVLWVENEAHDGTYGVRGQNSMRFVNHSSTPNAEFDAEALHSLRPIKPGEEITVDYGPDWAE